MTVLDTGIEQKPAVHAGPEMGDSSAVAFNALWVIDYAAANRFVTPGTARIAQMGVKACRAAELVPSIDPEAVEQRTAEQVVFTGNDLELVHRLETARELKLTAIIIAQHLVDTPQDSRPINERIGETIGVMQLLG